MVWNEPGKDKDPWNSQERPPDLERMVKNLHRRFSGLFGGKRGNQHHFRAATLLWLLPVIAVTWLLSGFYKVAPGERGVHFLLGRYTRVVQPGLHWHAPWPVGHADIISGVTGRDYTRSYNRLLTSDGNIVTVDAVARYHVAEVRDYLFNTAAPAGSAGSADAGTRTLLGTLVDAAIRAAVVHSSLENILGSGRDAVEVQAGDQLNAYLKAYDTGIAVTSLSFQHVSLPESVSGSDTDISKAQQDAVQARAAAQAYADNRLPQVKSEADARIAQAELYHTTLINQAQADTAGFDALLAAYRKAPALTRDMLYRQTMEQILGDASKVVVDTRSGNVTVQLNAVSQFPKPGMHKQAAAAMSASGGKVAATTPVGAASTSAPSAATHKRRL